MMKTGKVTQLSRDSKKIRAPKYLLAKIYGDAHWYLLDFGLSQLRLSLLKPIDKS
jgi:hypothetical protein